MSIKRIGKYLHFDELGITPSIGIETPILDDCVAEAQTQKFEGVFGSSCFRFTEESLDFLERLPQIRQVWFWDIDKIQNIDGLYALSGLEYFGIHEKRAPIDFSRFPQLGYASWHPVKKDKGIGGLQNLKHLDIWRFKNKEKSYADLEIPESLEKLEINWSNPTSLEGFPTLPNLKEIQFHYCRNLESISDLGRIAPNLKKLVITRCANLANYKVAIDMDLDHTYINIKGKEAFKRTKQN